ncbi:helix-turn-helix transcriptional regulator [Pseudorhodoplanes sinuspersici]
MTMTQKDVSHRIWAVEAARYLRVSRSTLAKWRMNGEGPPYHRMGPRLVYYYQNEIDAWLANCDVRKAAAPKA